MSQLENIKNLVTACIASLSCPLRNHLLFILKIFHSIFSSGLRPYRAMREGRWCMFFIAAPTLKYIVLAGPVLFPTTPLLLIRQVNESLSCREEFYPDVKILKASYISIGCSPM